MASNKSIKKINQILTQIVPPAFVPLLKTDQSIHPAQTFIFAVMAYADPKNKDKNKDKERKAIKGLVAHMIWNSYNGSNDVELRDAIHNTLQNAEGLNDTQRKGMEEEFSEVIEEIKKLKFPEEKATLLKRPNS